MQGFSDLISLLNDTPYREILLSSDCGRPEAGALVEAG
jgi:hypothetical protein